MEFQYRLAPDDYAAFAQHLLGTEGTGARRVRVQRFFLPALLVVLMLPSILGTRRLGLLHWALLLFAIAWLLFLPKYYAYKVASSLRKLAHSGMSKGAVGLQEMLVDAQGVTVRTAYGVDQRYWIGIERVTETPDHLFVMHGAHSGFIVPKSWIGEAVDELRQALATGLSTRG